MFSLRLKDGDLVISGGDLELVEDIEEIAQCVEVVLGTNKNEWFLNPELGIDYSKVVDKSTETQARNEIILGIAQEPRIDTINELTVTDDRKNRKRAINFKATSVEGEEVEREVMIDA